MPVAIRRKGASAEKYRAPASHHTTLAPIEIRCSNIDSQSSNFEASPIAPSPALGKQISLGKMEVIPMKIALLVIAFSAAIMAPLTAVSAKEPQDSSNTLTQGMVQMTLRVGTTTQTEVLETFGAPNLTTLDATGQEVWVYDRQATVSSSGSSGFSIGMLLGGGGSGVGGGGGLGFGSSKTKSTQTQRSMTLIIKFDADKRVTDFKSRSSSF